MRRKNAYRPYGGKKLHPFLRIVIGMIGLGNLCLSPKNIIHLMILKRNVKSICSLGKPNINYQIN